MLRPEKVCWSELKTRKVSKSVLKPDKVCKTMHKCAKGNNRECRETFVECEKNKLNPFCMNSGYRRTRE
jgi:hypothetical protein